MTTATSTPQINDNVKFEVLATTQVRSIKSFILCFCKKTIRAKQAMMHFAYFFLQRDQNGIIAKSLTQRKAL